MTISYVASNSIRDPIKQTGETKNAALGTVKDGAEGSKGIWDKIKGFAAKIGGAIKNFLFATAAFLKNQGVRIGTSLAIAVGVLAIVGCIVSLPVSLPLLAGIAGTIFAAGAIGKLIKNIRDPNVQGAANVIKQTFQDIKHDVIMGAKRTIKYITSPKTVYTDISEGILNNEKSIRGYKSNISALKDILDYSKADLGEGKHTKIGELKEQMEAFRGKIQGSKKPENLSEIEQERKKILSTLKELYKDRKIFEHVETRTTHIPFENILQNLIEKFASDSFMNTLREAPKAS